LLVPPCTAREGSIFSKLMLANSVVVSPRLRGTLACARSPLGALIRSGARPAFVPHSSTKTSLLGSSLLTRPLQALLGASSRSGASTVFARRSIPDGGSPGSSWRPTVPSWRIISTRPRMSTCSIFSRASKCGGVRLMASPSHSLDVVAAVELGWTLAAQDRGPPVDPQDRLRTIRPGRAFRLAPPLGEHALEDALLRVSGGV
jgi:hypothetical protein